MKGNSNLRARDDGEEETWVWRGTEGWRRSSRSRNDSPATMRSDSDLSDAVKRVSQPSQPSEPNEYMLVIAALRESVASWCCCCIVGTNHCSSWDGRNSMLRCLKQVFNSDPDELKQFESSRAEPSRKRGHFSLMLRLWGRIRICVWSCS